MQSYGRAFPRAGRYPAPGTKVIRDTPVLHGDADAIEGALYLYNREPVPSAAAWMDYQIRWMWSKQDSAHRANAQQFRGSGIVEGWHGDQSETFLVGDCDSEAVAVTQGAESRVEPSSSCTITSAMRSPASHSRYVANARTDDRTGSSRSWK